MKRLFRAFTLAEVLITLGIVGLVARVTLPALIQNVQEQQVEASLAKAINSLETGFQAILRETGNRTLGSAVVEGDILEPRELIEGSMSLYMNGSVIFEDLPSNGASTHESFVAKDGIWYTYATEIPGLLGRTPGFSPKYDGRYYKFLIDINGLNGPNQLAKDQFVVYVDNRGTVIPYGGAEFSEWRNVGAGRPRWRATCNTQQRPANAEAQATCTGSIVDNGYRIIYDY